MGAFDVVAVPLGWFDAMAKAAGWFDEIAIQADAAPPVTRRAPRAISISPAPMGRMRPR